MKLLNINEIKKFYSEKEIKKLESLLNDPLYEYEIERIINYLSFQCYGQGLDLDEIHTFYETIKGYLWFKREEANRIVNDDLLLFYNYCIDAFTEEYVEQIYKVILDMNENEKGWRAKEIINNL